MGIKELVLGDQRDPRRVLEGLFGGSAAAGSPPREAKDWAEAHLESAGIDPAEKPAQAIRVLRQREPRLPLKSAKYLVDNLVR